ncbi:DUF4397 domain-containing protein [Shewanella inventionis]|uniref:DUF4397 domain-containing protein n=1 Tax=Shewanella inventionis TaxID=1738770 RepID=A0ABQ1ISG8_9GAMM|nr:DUF4397 domain-containing protein [Shewanella inventionis]MCL1156886.1 DUF4397 domain-containing protein [Shewanella inventionis]UAL45180.1 DUF4397 domain-containing protein [Shewanella inventionis]GGB50971.1 hypothetical protein GCM10011607_09220 [Shewanella inventionis]
MKRIYPIAVCLSLIGLTACSDDDDKVVTEPMMNYSQLRVIHAGSDAPMVNVSIDGNQVLSGVDYAMSSGLLEVTSASYDIDVDAILADGTTLTVLNTSLMAEPDMEYTAIALGKVADETLSLKLVSNPVADIAAGYARVQVLHAAPSVDLVDVYVTAPGDDISAASPTVSANYMHVSTQLEVPAGDYQVRITASGLKDVVYDSGTIALSDMTDYFISAIPNTWSGDAPVALHVALADAEVIVNDVNSGSDIRVVHAVADAPAVDVFLDDATEPAVDMLSFGNATNYVNVFEGSHTVTVAADADNDVVVIDAASVSLALAKSYSVLAVGSLTDNAIEPLVLDELTRRVATEAKLSVVHAAYSAPEVDVYLTDTADITDATPVLSSVPFKASSGSLSVTPGTYNISVTVAGTKTVAIGPLEVTLDASGVYAVAAVDNVGGGAPFGVILLDDFTAM